MSATIKKYTLALLAGSTLVLAALSLLPSVALAQDETPARATQNANPPGAAASPNAPEPERSLVVNPGESLWSIAQYELGPEATPEQVLTEVQEIYQLNQTRIGGDPNLIFAGQVLSLPPVAAAPSPSPSTPQTGPEAAQGPSTNESATRTPQEAPAEAFPAAGSAAEAPEEQPGEEIPAAESAAEAPEEQPAEALPEEQDTPVSEAVPEEAGTRMLSYMTVGFGLVFTIVLVLFLVFLARRVPAKKW